MVALALTILLAKFIFIYP